MALEMTQLNVYKTFKDLGKGTKALEGYRKIRIHLTFDVKHDGWHKSRLVADGHHTEAHLTASTQVLSCCKGYASLSF